MKKLIIIAMLIASGALSAFASNLFVFTPITLTFHYYDSQISHPQEYPRTPVNMPEVYIEGYTILFHSDNLCDFIVLVDPENETTFAYYTAMPVGTDHIELPSYLHGEYEIRFCKETYYYSGIIEL